MKAANGAAIPTNDSTDPDLPDGCVAAEVFQRGISYTYDDVILHPGHISFPASDVDLVGHVSRNVPLKVPLVSSPMDSVTESLMAMWLALLGGIGIVHYNNTTEEQVQHVRRVKNHVVGFDTDPFVVPPNCTAGDFMARCEARRMQVACVTVTGELDSTYVGVVELRDVALDLDTSKCVGELATQNSA